MPSSLARQVLDKHWDRVLPVDPIKIAVSMGAEVIVSATLDVSGTFNRKGPNGKPVIHIRKDEPSVRKRFTVAHEIGHWQLNHDDSMRDPAKHFTADNFDPKERDANQFAAELLMPSDAVRQRVYSGQAHDLRELANAFGVSQAAMKYRLVNLGLRSNI